MLFYKKTKFVVRSQESASIDRKYHYLSSLLLLLILLSNHTYCQFGTIEKSNTLYSQILSDTIHYTVYFPPQYEKETFTGGVMFLLHGLGGNENNWIRNTHITQILDSLFQDTSSVAFIAIMPEGRNSYYINNFDNSFRWEDMFFQELVPYIDSIYFNKKQPISNAITGASMGGYGAVILAIKHPDFFDFSAAFSGALRTNSELIKMDEKKYTKIFTPVYGGPFEADKRITSHWEANNPFDILSSNPKIISELKQISWYFDCGTDDFLKPGNDSLNIVFNSHAIQHTYIIREGKHNWLYWDSGIRAVLEQYFNQINKSTSLRGHPCTRDQAAP